jgi:TRAP-type C4-dicarboxylate transport system permease large subunit
MSKNEKSDSFDDLLRRTVIQCYAGSASSVIYNRQSWLSVQEHLERNRLRRQRNQTIQTTAMIVITLAVSAMIMFRTFQSDYPQSICKWLEDIHEFSGKMK